MLLSGRRAAAIVVALVAVLLSGCQRSTATGTGALGVLTAGNTANPVGPANGGDQAGDGGAADIGLAARYDGHANVTIRIDDYCGNGANAGTKTYAFAASLTVGGPAVGGSQTEPNPFSFRLNTDDLTQVGAVSLESSFVTLTSGYDLSGRPRDANLLLTYWKVKLDGSELSARLTDRHESEGEQRNQVNLEQITFTCVEANDKLPGGGGFSWPIQEGATLTGTLTASSADLTLTADAANSAVVTMHFTA
jgi:hypothetical protein